MTIFPIAYAPNIDYLKKIINCDDFKLELFEYFPKQTIRNHTIISTANGAMKLSIPLQGRKNKSLTKDIKISYSEPWQKLHFKALETAYNSSPYFEFYNYLIEPFYIKKYNYLIDFNVELMRCLFKMLNISTDIKFTETFQTINSFHDFRGDDFMLELQDPYYQVFSDKNGFIKNLGLYDLLFNEGTQAKEYLLKNLTAINNSK